MSAIHRYSKPELTPIELGERFERSLSAEDRRRTGTHYTLEEDIERVIRPALIQPLWHTFQQASGIEDYKTLLDHIHHLHILDPACGCGNFLYVAYRSLLRFELMLLNHIEHLGHKPGIDPTHLVNPLQFYGIDIDARAVELARAALPAARSMVLQEAGISAGGDCLYSPNDLQHNILQADALFCEWPSADIIIGNPPFHGKNKAQKELGAGYMRRVRERYPAISGRADLCVYWFRRAHDELREGGRAGLVGTNTISQNESREGGLAYIVANGGTITEAIPSHRWPGDADVHVSIVNWIKGGTPEKKVIWERKREGETLQWIAREVNDITPSLGAGPDAGEAATLRANRNSGTCYQGQTPGHWAFLISPQSAAQWTSESEKHREILFPYLTGQDLLIHPESKPSRYIIDMHQKPLGEAQRYTKAYPHIERRVLASRRKAAEEERHSNEIVRSEEAKARINRHHQNFLNRWWLLSYPRDELIRRIQGLKRYIVCSRIARRPIFEFVSQAIRPSDALMVFCFEDDYSFGILQSAFHWTWLKARCSTLKGDFRYTSNTVYDSFVWPGRASQADIQAIAAKAVELRMLRRKLMREQGIGFRSLYASLDTPGRHPLKEAQQALDQAVRAAYGMGSKEDILAFLLNENQGAAALEREGKPVNGPGLPAWVKNVSHFVSGDCVGEP